MKRRTLLAGGVAAATLAAPALRAQSTTEIKVLYSIPDLFKTLHEQIAAEFMKVNPQYKVTFLAPQPAYEEIAQATLRAAVTNTLPDVAYQGLNRQRIFFDRGLAQPLDALIAADPDFKSYGHSPGLLDVGRPRPGDTVVISAASGAVGQLVGQVAKLAGCRAVAIAGSDEKLQWCREIGFDAAINYRTSSNLPGAVKEACADGVHVFFDNTAGPIHDAVMKNLAVGARVVICGRVALASQFGKPDVGERFMGQLIVTRASVHGFLVFDWWHRRDEALKRLAEWWCAGHIRFKEDVLDGI